MEAEDTHMVKELSETHAKLKKKLAEPNVLDSFTKLTSDVDKVRFSAGVKLLQHLTNQDCEKVESEKFYALDRLIRGVGSSRTSAKTGFYTVLVSFLTNTSSITVEQVLESVKKHLSTVGSNSKGENADISMGQILVCGALIHSEMFTKATSEEQTKIIQMLITAGSKRSYLSLASYTYLIELLQKCDEKQFQKVLWPIMKPEISKPWTEQNLDTIYFIAVARKLFPGVIKQKFINKHLQAPEIVHESSVTPLCELLLNVPMFATLRHPIYPFIGKQLSESTFIPAWCKEMDQHLAKPTRNKHLVTTMLLTTILENMSNLTEIPDMLTNQYLTITINTFRNTRAKEKDDDFIKKMYIFFDVLVKTLKKEEVNTKTKITILKKLLYYPGTFNFEKITRSKLVQQITIGLNAEGVKKLSKLYKEVVLASKPKVYGDKLEAWINMDRIYAAQLLVKLIGHPAAQKETEWRMEQAKFLLRIGLFKTESESNISVELAAAFKDCFFRVLDLKLPKLEDLRHILSSLIHHIDEEIFSTNNLDKLRISLPEEGPEIWKNMINLIETLEQKKKFKHGYAVPVFHTLLLHMGLQLLSDFDMAQNALKELHSCFKKLETHKQKKEESDTEPVWIEVVIDLFLSFLSQNSHLLRSVIGCVFPYLCPHLTITALHQILEVLDPLNEENPLSKINDASSDEDNSDEENSDEDNSNDDDDDDENDDENDVIEPHSDEESEISEMEEENMDEEHETATDKLRMAVRDALCKSGYQTDEESIDVDDIGEEEGEKLNEALAEAFRNVKRSKGKNSRQNKDDKTLTHFRVRVLDLIEMYLESEPGMLFCLEIAISLLQILEYSIRDTHQKPLQNRVCGCLKKLSAIKKFSSTEGVTETVLFEMLNSFLDKGSKSAFIYQDMGDKIADCCMFIIRCSQLLSVENMTPKKSKKKLLKSPLVEIFKNSLESFFNKRDSLLPIVLFKNALNISWEGNWALIPLLVEYPFDNDIRPFRRSQALELLRLFYSNNRFRITDLDNFKKKIAPIESKISENSIELLKNLSENPKECKIKEKFVCHLLNLLSAIKRANATTNVDWQSIGNYVRIYRSHVTLAKDAKVAYNKLCRALGIPNLVKMQVAQTNGHQPSLDEDETQSEANSQDKKKDKKRQKNKSLKNDKQKLKKEARLLRLKASSEGLEDNFDFSNISLTDIKIAEPESEENSETETPKKSKKKKKLNGSLENDTTENQNSPKKRHNSQSEDVPKKKKKKNNK